VQPQNFPRPSVKEIEGWIDPVLFGDYDVIAEKLPVMEVLSSMLRSMLVPPEGQAFLCADFSAIEGWVVAWLAGQSGMTSYEEMAARIFNVAEEDVTEEQRAVGKVAVLGCGFGMGWKRYQQTVYEWTGIEISDELAQLVVDTYRTLNVQIKDLWYDLEDAALAAVASPGRKVKAGRGGCITYRVKGPYLWCQLPSNRLLCYPLPKLVDGLTPWGTEKRQVEISTTNSYTRKWERRTLYGGLQTENVVQAIARDVMLDAMFRVEDAGYETVLTVHDEVLTQSTMKTIDLEAFEAIMSEPVSWAPGLVVKAEGWVGSRYRK
jgi:DNA polymerase